MSTIEQAWYYNETSWPFEHFSHLEQQASDTLDDITVNMGDDQTLVWASAGERYQYALFGRDSARIAYDLINSPDQNSQETGLRILNALSAHQFENKQRPRWRQNPFTYPRRREAYIKSEAEPGKVIHEWRAKRFGEIEASDIALDILARLAKSRGGDEESMTDYGTVDAPALFLIAYEAAWKLQAQHRETTHSTGQRRTLLETAQASKKWIKEQLKSSDIGLIETMPGPYGSTRIESWKDSMTSHIHTDGTRATAPIASIEVLAHTYEALHTYVDDDEEWKDSLDMMYDLRTIAGSPQRFWMPDHKPYPYFAMGIDRDDEGNPRQIKTITADVGMLLDHGVFGKEGYHHEYVGGIVRTLFSDALLCDGGLRSRSIEHKDLVPFADLHGSYVVWAMQTHAVARGLYKQGMHRLAAELWVRMLSGLEVSGSMQEFNYFDTNGSLLLPANEHALSGDPVGWKAETHPQTGQGWTASAVKGAMSYLRKIDLEWGAEGPPYPVWMLDKPQHNVPVWVTDLEEEILGKIPNYRHNPAELIQRIREQAKPYILAQVAVNERFEVILD